MTDLDQWKLTLDKSGLKYLVETFNQPGNKCVCIIIREDENPSTFDSLWNRAFVQIAFDLETHKFTQLTSWETD